MADDNIQLDGAVLTYQDLNFYFGVITHEEIKFSNEITDHLVEDNSYIQDHIAVKPNVYTLSGIVSEKMFTTPDEIIVQIPTEPLSAQLSTLAVIAPTVSSYVYSAINAYNVISSRVKKIVNTIKKSYNSIKNIIRKTTGGTTATVRHLNDTKANWNKDYIQSTTLQIFDKLCLYRIPVRISTGWGLNIVEEDNFYITDVTLIQENTYQQSTLTVTVKQLRFASTKTRSATADELTARNDIYANQSEDADNPLKIQGNRTPLARTLDEMKGKQ